MCGKSIQKSNSPSLSFCVFPLPYKEAGRQSAATLAKKIGVSAKAIEKQLAKLKADGILDRKGPAKGGEWVVAEIMN